MTPVERAFDLIKSKGSARTPDIAKALSMLPHQVDELLAGPKSAGFLITCAVEIGDGQHVTEYRCTSAGGGKALIPQFCFPPKKPAAERAPDRAPKPVTIPPPARPAAPQENTTMSEKKTIPERVLEALKKHGQCTVEDLVKHTGSTAASLSTYLGKIPGVRRAARGVYELEQAKPRQRVALAAGAELGRKQPGTAVPARNGTGAQFAINEQGELGIEQGASKVRLDADEFQRLRAFIDRTASVWKGVQA